MCDELGRAWYAGLQRKDVGFMVFSFRKLPVGNRSDLPIMRPLDGLLIEQIRRHYFPTPISRKTQSAAACALLAAVKNADGLSPKALSHPPI
jgi:hypothetical protein